MDGDGRHPGPAARLSAAGRARLQRLGLAGSGNGVTTFSPVAASRIADWPFKLPDGRTSNGVLIGAAAGAPVTAVADGTVVFSEWMTGYGLILIIDHGNGYMSLYAHNDTLLRDVGARVRKGEQVARVGSSGGHGRPALYFELRRDGKPVDPSAWLQRR